MLRLSFCLCALAVFYPAHSFAGDSTAPFSQWWCTPFAEKSAHCTRFVLNEKPAKAISATVHAKGNRAMMTFREAALLDRHAVDGNTLTYALPGSKPGREITFTAESDTAATKMLPGGTWMSFHRDPQMDALADAAEKAYCPGGFARFSGTVKTGEGDALFTLDTAQGTVTPLAVEIKEYLGPGPYIVRAYSETWSPDGDRITSVVNVTTTGGSGRSFKLEIRTKENTLFLLSSSLEERPPLLEVPLATEHKGL